MCTSSAFIVYLHLYVQQFTYIGKYLHVCSIWQKHMQDTYCPDFARVHKLLLCWGRQSCKQYLCIIIGLSMHHHFPHVHFTIHNAILIRLAIQHIQLSIFFMLKNIDFSNLLILQIPKLLKLLTLITVFRNFNQ